MVRHARLGWTVLALRIVIDELMPWRGVADENVPASGEGHESP